MDVKNMGPRGVAVRAKIAKVLYLVALAIWAGVWYSDINAWVRLQTVCVCALVFFHVAAVNHREHTPVISAAA